MSRALSQQMNISPAATLLAPLRDLVAVWRRRMWERENLASLGDRDLHDLGVSRAAIEYEASKPFWRA